MAIENSGYVYCVRLLVPNYEHRPLKIGFSLNPTRRALVVSWGLPYPVEVVAIWPTRAGRETERAIHSRFKQFKLQGEWFHPAPELLDYIANAPRLASLPQRERIIEQLSARKDEFIPEAEAANLMVMTPISLQHLKDCGLLNVWTFKNEIKYSAASLLNLVERTEQAINGVARL